LGALLSAGAGSSLAVIFDHDGFISFFTEDDIASAHFRSFKILHGDVEPESEAFIEYEFPPTLEIPSVTALITHYADCKRHWVLRVD
jgi:hypothetical protein